jgi:hypothetical protein
MTSGRKTRSAFTTKDTKQKEEIYSSSRVLRGWKGAGYRFATNKQTQRVSVDIRPKCGILSGHDPAAIESGFQDPAGERDP